jgi:hypothetical protein
MALILPLDQVRTAKKAMSQNSSANPVKELRGAFADASGWKVIPMLKAKGLHAAVVQKPLTAAVMMSSDVRFAAPVHSPAGSPEGAR